jgi:hypothetical protein
MGKTYIVIYIIIQEFNTVNICNLEVNMHLKNCNHEHFDLISSPFKYKC